MIKVSKVRMVRTWLRLLVGFGIALAVLFAAALYIGVSPRTLGHLLWILPLFGAVSNSAVAAIGGGRLVRTFTVTATADADTTTGNIAHGFLDEAGVAVAPDEVIIRPLIAPARISLWVVTTLDATNIALGKATTVGSGDAAAQIRVTMIRFHSMVR